MLTNRFPCHLRSLSTLHVLILRSNSLHGLIKCPNSISDWKMLQIVDLASNNFVGQLLEALLRVMAMISIKDKDKPRFSVHDLYEIPNLFKFRIASLVMNNHRLKKKLVKFLWNKPYSHLTMNPLTYILIFMLILF